MVQYKTLTEKIRDQLTTSDRIIYWDMDGVVANTNLVFYNKFQLKLEDLDKEGKSNEIWSRIDPLIEHGFFENLPVFEPGIKMLNKYIENGYDCQILSSCGESRFDEIKTQKKKWLKNNGITIKQNFVHNALEKGNYAKNKHILIDDRQKCINAFNEKGGIGILFEGFDYYG